MKSCPKCLSNQLQSIHDATEVTETALTYVIENIPAIQCVQCQTVHHTKESEQYINHQLSIFRANGFENRLRIVAKQKEITQTELGERLGGLTKQRISQIMKDDNLDAQTMIRISKALSEPVNEIFRFRTIIEQENKFYISD